MLSLKNCIMECCIDEYGGEAGGLAACHTPIYIALQVVSHPILTEAASRCA